LFYLFQDAEEGQDPWKTVQNPFPNWKKWHVNPTEVGKNRDKQGDTDEWTGDEASASPNTATYVVQVTDKASARDAIHAIAVQGEGPIGEQGATHFDKFLDIFRQLEALSSASPQDFARKQAANPRSRQVRPIEGTTITNPKTLAWAKLASTRYQMLLIDIALSLSIAPTDEMHQCYVGWSFAEMKTASRLSDALREMAVEANSDLPKAGHPFELPETELVTTKEKLKSLLKNSQALQTEILGKHQPSAHESTLLVSIKGIDDDMTKPNRLGPI
jgi:Ferritin-like